MSVLVNEPDGVLDAMFAVLRRRADAAEYGADSQDWDD